jgi:hypothetical protein
MTMSRFLLSAMLLTGSACTVGEVSIGQNNNGTDGGNTGGDSGNQTSPRDVCSDRGTPGAAHVHVAAPATNRAGIGCVAVGCHLAGQTGAGASPYAFAGTVYKQVGGTAPNPGAVVRIFKEGPTGVFTKVTQGVADDAGNFRIAGNFTDFPYITDVSVCGADAPVMGIRPMIGPIGNANANCNGGAACHAVPGTLAIWLAD